MLYCHVLGIPIFILCVWLDDGDEFNRGMHSHYFAYLSPPCLNPCIFVLFSLFFTAKSVTDVDFTETMYTDLDFGNEKPLEVRLIFKIIFL